MERAVFPDAVGPSRARKDGTPGFRLSGPETAREDLIPTTASCFHVS
jgi:hypothetical protein